MAALKTEPPDAPALSPAELARWAWRQLTSMRTALLLLLLLALASVPGSVFPQENVAPAEVSRWRDDHPALAPVYDRLGLFDVYSSVWFSAIYILLAMSLLGCIVPRLRVYWRAVRAQPPSAPRNLSRLPSYQRVEVEAEPGIVLASARDALRRRRFRLRAPGDEADGSAAESVGAERGYLREAGNLVFHLAVLVVLAGFAIGQLFGYTGGRILLVGDTFANAPLAYDEFAPGRLLDVDGLAPLQLTVDDFTVDYHLTGPAVGTPRDFDAALTYLETPDGPRRRYDLAVNHPLTLDGVDVFLVGNGYAPVVTVRDGNGDVASRGPVVFLPQDGSFRSYGVIKAAGARPTQLGFEGEFYPTYAFTEETGPYSSFPDVLDPRLSLLAYAGDLGLDTGEAQNVFLLDKDGVEVVMKPGKEGSEEPGDRFRVDLAVGETVELPGGLGSIEFTGVQRWVKLQISDSPGESVALGGVIAAILGLMASLFIRPRRVWVRVRRDQGRTVVEVAGLDRSASGEGLDAEVRDLAQTLVGSAASGGAAPGPGKEAQ